MTSSNVGTLDDIKCVLNSDIVKRRLLWMCTLLYQFLHITTLENLIPEMTVNYIILNNIKVTRIVFIAVMTQI